MAENTQKPGPRSFFQGSTTCSASMAIGVLGLALTGCRGDQPDLPATRSATASAPSPLAAGPLPRAAALRLSLAKQLAQQSQEASRETLEQLLHDDDVETLSWAAFGLGQLCQSHEAETVRALVSRAASLATQPGPVPASISQSFTLALSRCNRPEAEHTLLSWLSLPSTVSTYAALGLARLADRQRALEDSSLVGLLDAADDPAEPVYAAMLAMDRLPGLAPSAAARISDVAATALKVTGEPRAFAIAALTHGDERADALLSAVVTDSHFSVSERAGAIRALARRGAQGQAALGHALPKLAESFSRPDDLTRAPWPVLVAALRSMTSDYSHKAQRTLSQWASWRKPEAAPNFVQHRITIARCLSATLLAKDDSLDAQLMGCDEHAGIVGELAQIEVLERAEISGARADQWRKLLASRRPRVRQAALKLIGDHQELPTGALTEALHDAQPGTVAAAALLLAKYPSRALGSASNANPGALDETLVKAMTAAFNRQYGPDQIAVRGALAEAAAALQILSLKSKIEQLCLDPSPTLRSKAKRALVMLGDSKVTCTAPQQVLAAKSAAPALGRPIIVAFETSAGQHTIELRPDLAPNTVQRVLDLVAEGFYNNMAIHRAAPGQVVQIGDPVGDGYGGCGRPAIVSEPSAQHFGAFTVGMADFGDDTASSQLFITLVAQPSLDGEYTWIGTASRGWQDLVLDDVIERAHVD